MSLLAFADTQIGVTTVDLADQKAVLDRMVQVALDKRVDLVVHGGDVFEGPVVTPEHLRVFLDGIRPLRDQKIPVIVIRGNGRHDLATRTVHALDVLREVDGIVVSDRPEALTEYGVATLPWVHPGHLLARIAHTAFDRDKVHERMAKALVQIAGDMTEQLMRHEEKVLVAHWAISGSALPTGISSEDLREPVLEWADLDVLGYDAVIGAHIHKPQQISQPLIDRTLGIVVGSPQSLNHGEAGYEHGCWIVEVGDGPATAEFVPIESKRFVTIGIRENDADEIREGDIVRVRFTATEEEARQVEQARIRQELLDLGASKVTIEPQIVRADRARATSMTEELSPLDALEMYAEAQGLESGLAGRMRDRLESWITA